jgi:L-2-hydroxyglutarate oxidase
VYPVPDVAMPFLGVHFTVTVDGRCKIGPTAVPALWRQHYGGPDGALAHFSAAEMAEVLWTEARMLAARPELRVLAASELRKALSRSAMVAGAAELVPSATLDRFTAYGRAGIRAQLVRTDAGMALEMDYVLRGDAWSTHVLNAISPAWTCSRPFAELVVDRVMAR